MKKLAFLLLLCITFSVNAQLVYFQTEFYNTRFYNESLQQFDPWLGWQESNLNITLDKEEDVIVVHSKYLQRYKILTGLENENAIDVYKFSAVDEEGLNCLIQIIRFPNERYQIYIRWSNLEIAYQMQRR